MADQPSSSEASAGSNHQFMMHIRGLLYAGAYSLDSVTWCRPALDWTTCFADSADVNN